MEGVSSKLKVNTSKSYISPSCRTSDFEKTKSKKKKFQIPVGEKFHTANSQKLILSFFTVWR